MQVRELGILSAVVLWLLALAGCAAPVPYLAQKPPISQSFVPIADPDFVYDNVVDVVDDYFRIQQEVRTKVIGNTVTEGRIDTYPEISATLLEPWRRDVATGYDRLEATLQTIRRYAIVRVIPSGGGYVVDVAVFKDLEDLPKPEQSPTGTATFRNEQSLSRFNEPVGSQAVSLGWIPLGRDPGLEQKILCKLQARLGSKTGVPMIGAPPCDVPPGMIPVAPGAIPPGEFGPQLETIPRPSAIEPPRQLLPTPTP